MKAQIISIGNELLIGDTINTNAGWLGEYLTGLGFSVSSIHTISDEEGAIRNTLKMAMKEADLVISTGGLGPTHDDITKKAVAELFGVGFKEHHPTLEHIKSLFKKRNIPFSRSNYAQAEVPENCEVLFNNSGTAPGMWFCENGSCLAVLPGVPYEMKYLMKTRVSRKLKEVFGDTGHLYSRYIKTAGIGESTLHDEVLGDLSSFMNDHVSLAFQPSNGILTLRLNGKGESREEAEQKVQALADVIYSRAGNYIYGEGKECTLSEAVGKKLNEKGLSIAVAESCTGGLVCDSLTDVPGSSRYVKGGIISYANEVKMNQLGVKESDLKSVGAVSKEVALQMAKGVAERLNTDIGISTTGIAGPDGGTEEKPVGTVWMGFYWMGKDHFALQALFTKDRLMNKQRTMVVLLETVRRVLEEIESMPYELERHRA